MSTPAQIAANQANAQLSTGPQTQAGKAAVAQNNLHHGLSGSSFHLLSGESQSEFDRLLAELRDQYAPATHFEIRLSEKAAQHFWLSDRAVRLQTEMIDADPHESVSARDLRNKQLALYLRYQTTHDRAFKSTSDQLRKLRDDRRKAQIGFESQKARAAGRAEKEVERQAAAAHRAEQQKLAAERQGAQENRRQAAEQRKADKHQWAETLNMLRCDEIEMRMRGQERDRLIAELDSRSRPELSTTPKAA